MQASTIAFATVGGAFGGVILAFAVRGIAPVNHKTYIDWLIMFGATSVAYRAYARGVEDSASSFGTWAGNTLAMAYIVGGTPVTRSIGIA